MPTSVRDKIAARPNLLRHIAILCVVVYLSASALSLIIAHVLLVVTPNSNWGERLIAPVARGLEFLDIHWKPVLILLLAPFVAPVARDLISRLRKAWGLEFDPVPLEQEAVREKPHQGQSGAPQ